MFKTILFRIVSDVRSLRASFPGFQPRTLALVCRAAAPLGLGSKETSPCGAAPTVMPAGTAYEAAVRTLCRSPPDSMLRSGRTCHTVSKFCGADACCQAPTDIASCLCAVLTRIGDWVHEEQLSPEECRRSLSGLSGAYVAAAMMWLAWWDSNPRHSG